MGKYGEAAVLAVGKFQSSDVESPNQAWEMAVQKVFPGSKSSQEKGCPKGAFLGLCSEGLIKGVPSGHYTRSEKNKKYAVDAVALLKQTSSLATDDKALWMLVMDGEEKVPNSQMDVVIALWDKNIILRKGE